MGAVRGAEQSGVAVVAQLAGRADRRHSRRGTGELRRVQQGRGPRAEHAIRHALDARATLHECCRLAQLLRGAAGTGVGVRAHGTRGPDAVHSEGTARGQQRGVRDGGAGGRSDLLRTATARDGGGGEEEAGGGERGHGGPADQSRARLRVRSPVRRAWLLSYLTCRDCSSPWRRWRS